MCKVKEGEGLVRFSFLQITSGHDDVDRFRIPRQILVLLHEVGDPDPLRNVKFPAFRHEYAAQKIEKG